MRSCVRGVLLVSLLGLLWLGAPVMAAAPRADASPGSAAAVATAAQRVAAAPRDLTVTASQQLSPRLWELTMQTAALDFPVHVRVLLPDGYRDSPRRRYPVLYLLHGSFDNAASWTAEGNAERLTAGKPLIVVMPATAGKGNAGGWASDWRNEGLGGPPQWETFT